MPPKDPSADDQPIDLLYDVVQSTGPSLEEDGERKLTEARSKFEAQRISRRSALRKMGLTFGQVSAGFMLSEPFVHAVVMRLDQHKTNSELAMSLLEGIEHSADTLVTAEDNLNAQVDPQPNVEGQQPSSSSATGGGGGGGAHSSSSSFCYRRWWRDFVREFQFCWRRWTPR